MVRSVTLSAGVLELVRGEGAKAYPREACGVLIGRGPNELSPGRSPERSVAGGASRDASVVVNRAVACPNKAEPNERGHRFLIDPRAIFNLMRAVRGTEESILGYFHSHPDAEPAPSSTDMRYIRLWPKVVWLITGVSLGRPGETRAWWLDDERERKPRMLACDVTTPVPAGCPE